MTPWENHKYVQAVSVYMTLLARCGVQNISIWDVGL